MFHTMGLSAVVAEIAAGETAVLVTGERAGTAEVLRAAAEHGAARVLAAPPVVAAMAKAGRAALPALELVLCGGAPLHAAVAERFRKMFPSVELAEVPLFFSFFFFDFAPGSSDLLIYLMES